jgi:hypothetical protein
MLHARFLLTVSFSCPAETHRAQTDARLLRAYFSGRTVDSLKKIPWTGQSITRLYGRKIPLHLELSTIYPQGENSRTGCIIFFEIFCKVNVIKRIKTFVSNNQCGIYLLVFPLTVWAVDNSLIIR